MNDWLYYILKNASLEEYYQQLVTNLNITLPEHFDHVKKQDLEKLGLSQPARRRLLKALKDYKKDPKIPATPINKSQFKESSPTSPSSSGGLIQENEIKLSGKLGDGFSGMAT